MEPARSLCHLVSRQFWICFDLISFVYFFTRNILQINVVNHILLDALFLHIGISALYMMIPAEFL